MVVIKECWPMPHPAGQLQNLQWSSLVSLRFQIQLFLKKLQVSVCYWPQNCWYDKEVCLLGCIGYIFHHCRTGIKARQSKTNRSTNAFSLLCSDTKIWKRGSSIDSQVGSKWPLKGTLIKSIFITFSNPVIDSFHIFSVFIAIMIHHPLGYLLSGDQDRE